MPYISFTKQLIDLSLTYVVHAKNVYSYVKYVYRKFFSGREIQGGQIETLLFLFLNNE